MDATVELDSRRAYRAARGSLKRAIKKARSRSWRELIDTIDRDPWGLPYKIVLGKLRPSGPSLSETLESDSLSALLDSLFPSGASRVSRPARGPPPPNVWEDEHDVSYLEIHEFVKKRPARNAAPGPDNIKATVWKGVPGIILAHISNICTLSLRQGVFPEMWRRAILVLIPKGRVDPGRELKARPICLLDELGKTLERVIAFRIVKWMDEHPESSLSAYQFGFRRNRSTVDALLHVREYTREIVEGGGFAIVVGLDIANAFNSIPWSVILGALERRGFPPYLRAVVGSYLSGRSIQFKGSSGRVRIREVCAGVPQGSVLGPLLWNIAFDTVMGLPAEEGCRTLCYADDTLVIAKAGRLFEAIISANLQIERVVRHISSLGLRVAEAKTEAVLLCGQLPRVMPAVRVGSVRIGVAESMRYLGVIIDSRWNFRTHLKYVEGKVASISRALSRLMPNLRGPGERKRRLYSNVLTSVAMYASPVWGERYAASPRLVSRPLRNVQRAIEIRVIAGYRTISFDAATLLARMPPWPLEATLRARVYKRTGELRRRGEGSIEAIEEVRREEGVLLIRQWDILLNSPGAWSVRTSAAVGPHLYRWTNRTHGDTNHYVTQFMTGHGSFAHYLWRIGKRDTAQCDYCPYPDDTLEHTLMECLAWDMQRLEMLRVMRSPFVLDLSGVVEAILRDKANWLSFAAFASFVTRAKVEEERRRERGVSPIPSSVASS